MTVAKTEALASAISVFSSCHRTQQGPQTPCFTLDTSPSLLAEGQGCRRRSIDAVGSGCLCGDHEHMQPGPEITSQAERGQDTDFSPGAGTPSHE